MNNGAFGENFPYSNFHDLNMDWIIKIAKDFLDQYTHIQEVITNGEQSLQDLTTSGLEQLQEKADALEALLQKWYDTHSEDIANQLADALADLQQWYETHSKDIANQLTDAISSFDTHAIQQAEQTIASIPQDYSTLSREVSDLFERLIDTQRTLLDNYTNLQLYPVWYQYGISGDTGEVTGDTSQIHTDFIFCANEIVKFIPKQGYKLHVRWYSNRSVTSFIGSQNNVSGEVTPQGNYMRLVCTRADFSDNITPSEGNGNSIAIYRSVLQRGFILTNDPNNYDIPSNVQVDTIAKTITFGSGYCRLFTNRHTSYNISGKTLDYSSAPSYFRILFNLDTSAFEYYPAGDNPPAPSKYVDVGSIWSLSNTQVNLHCYPGYSVNGIRTTLTDDKYYLSDIHEQNGAGICRIAILGDSISTYTGISESELNGVAVRGAYYPASDVTSADEMWYNVLRKCLRSASDYIVSAVSRSGFIDTHEPTEPPVWNDYRIARLANFPNIKYIFIECGVNQQWNSLADIGTPTNKWDITSIGNRNTGCAGLELTIRKLQNQIPNAKIVLLIPPFTYGDTVTNYEPYTTFRKYMREIGNTYGIFRIIDLANCITPTNRSTYTIDGIHPNKAGMKRIGHYIANQLMYNNDSVDY